MLNFNHLSKSNSYPFRQSTLDQSQKQQTHAKSPHNGRRELSPTRTPTLVREAEHDCDQIDPENTHIKVVQRIWNTYFRMLVADIFGCSTSRGTTRLNGSISHCDCQSGHCSLARTLYDNKLQIIAKLVSENGYEALTPTSEKYLSLRFGLDTPARVELYEAHSPERHIQDLMRRLTERQRKGSFVDTELEKIRNATFENPTASNRLDCHLEYHLRTFEDELAVECSSREKSPIQCTETLTKKYVEMLLNHPRLKAGDSCFKAPLAGQLHRL